jgi:hypothetical protein
VSHQAKPLAKEFYNALATWIAALIAVSLAPIPTSLIHNLTTVLIAAGASLGVVWLARHAEPGELEPPSRLRTTGFSLMAAGILTALIVGRQAGITEAINPAVWPFVVGLAGSITALVPVIGLWKVPPPVAAVIGGGAALLAGLVLAETNIAVVLACQCLAPGAMIGGAAAVLMRRARELAGDTRTAVMDVTSQ